LPQQITKIGGGGGSLKFTYDASGRKWKKEGAGGKREYVLGMEYQDGRLEAIHGPDGRLASVHGFGYYRPEYWHTDHLGNVRLAFSDVNNNGRIEIEDDPGTPGDDTEVMQENHYYPFGMNQMGPWYETVTPPNKYQYNGKELNEELGLDWLDYGARWYDAAVGRFTSVDPIAEMFPDASPFGYAAGNPATNIDLLGLSPARKKRKREETLEDLIQDAWDSTPENESRTFMINNSRSDENPSENEEGTDDCCPGGIHPMGMIRAAEARAKEEGREVKDVMAEMVKEQHAAQAEIAPDLILTAVGGWVIGRVFQGGKWVLGMVRAGKAAKGSTQAFKAFTKSNYRHNLQVLTSKSGVGMDAHHIFPQASRFQQHWNRVGLNIHDPKNLVWWESGAHRGATGAYNKAWDAFFRQYPNANFQQIQNFGKSLMKSYGF
jgi:RHS repeat-associated protein